jgi:1,4-dihydroxy-2-naphthoate octaprenyltransferase
MAGALLMQAITNLQNDVGFTARGAEAVGRRIGLPRATAEGWLSMAAVRRALFGLCALALWVGVTLTLARGWPVLVIGAFSLVAALAYMGGPRPIAYTPLGEAVVVLFFGWIAVLGTLWLVSDGALRPSATDMLAASAVGCLAAAALTVNNHRDADHDRLVGRHTFVVKFGADASTRLLAGWLSVPFVACAVLALTESPWLSLPLLCAPVAAGVHRDFRRCTAGLAYNAILLRVFRLALGYAALLSIGAVLARRPVFAWLQ